MDIPNRNAISNSSLRLTYPYQATINMQGCHSQGKVREKRIFFKVSEKSGNKSGNFASSQGYSKFLVKVSEKSENFIFRLPQALSSQRLSLGMSFSK